MSITMDDIINIGQKNIKDSINFIENSRFIINPLTSSNRGICMSIPVRCYPETSTEAIVLPTFININMLEGNISLCFDKVSSTIYKYDSIGSPLILKNNILIDNRFDRNKYDCCIEEIPITQESIKAIPNFDDVKLVSNIVTCGSKPRYNSNKVSIPMYIGNQLTFPNSGKDSKLFYIINDTFAIGTRSKWIVSDTFDNFKGSMHVYLTVATCKDINDPTYMRVNYLYIQIKRKVLSCIGDIIACNGKLFSITATDLYAGGESE